MCSNWGLQAGDVANLGHMKKGRGSGRNVAQTLPIEASPREGEKEQAPPLAQELLSGTAVSECNVDTISGSLDKVSLVPHEWDANLTTAILHACVACCR